MLELALCRFDEKLIEFKAKKIVKWNDVDKIEDKIAGNVYKEKKNNTKRRS